MSSEQVELELKPRKKYRNRRFKRRKNRFTPGNSLENNLEIGNRPQKRRQYDSHTRNASSSETPGEGNDAEVQGKKPRFNKKKDLVIHSLKEEEVGITEYINQQRFFGILKMRYSDFHVSEISKDGQICKLTDQTVPSMAQKKEDIDVIKEDIPETIWLKLQSINEENALPLEIDVSECTKPQRQKIHASVRILAKEPRIVSKTMETDGKKIILVEQEALGSKQRDRDCINWQDYGGEWCRFVLHKLNVHTMTAIIQMASVLRVKPNRFQFAGTKDRRGCTSQWFTLWKVHPANILRAARHTHRVFVGNFEFVKEPLHLGQLKGNHFRIALRSITESDGEIEKAMVLLQKNGFINYFGLQRFGASALVPSYAIGIALLQGEWEKAIELILTPKKEEEDRDLMEAKQIYQSNKNAEEAYKKVKNKSTIEAELLKGICICGRTNPLGALDWTPKNMRTMYMHSYQSLVWNHMVSRRIREFGKEPIVGDLVYAEESVENLETDPECVEWNTNECNSDLQQDDDTSGTNPKENDTPSTTGKNEQEDRPPRIPAVKTLTENDISRYTLADIIMPTPGNSVEYPPYAKAWYEEFMAKDNLSIELQQKNLKYCLSGNYRNVLQVPTNMSWKIIRHKEITRDLLPSDINEFRGMKAPENQPDGQYKSLIVEMSLKASTYATMALREILNCGTSKQEQATFSVKYHADAELENLQDSKPEKISVQEDNA